MVPRLQGSEPVIEAQLLAQGLVAPVIAYVPRLSTTGASPAAATTCACQYSSLAFRQSMAWATFGPLYPSGVLLVRPVSEQGSTGHRACE